MSLIYPILVGTLHPLVEFIVIMSPTQNMNIRTRILCHLFSENLQYPE